MEVSMRMFLALGIAGSAVLASGQTVQPAPNLSVQMTANSIQRTGPTTLQAVVAQVPLLDLLRADRFALVMEFGEPEGVLSCRVA
jgi:hypothetical protein